MYTSPFFSCSFNCLKKMNPSERLVVATICVDCKPTDQLGFEWSSFILELGKDKNDMASWTKQPNFAKNTTTGIDKGNIVINPNYFIPGREYFLRLNAWKPGGYPGGFVEYQFVVNVGPTGGTCDFAPLFGYALNTPFNFKCNKWKDPDTPLLYTIGKLLKISQFFNHDDTFLTIIKRCCAVVLL